MSLNSTPRAERVHIGFFGRRNAGKSSLVNAFTNQELALVSDIKGTTTDPVFKSMELLPMGPVTIIDTPGIDDEGTLGEMRVKKAKQVLNKTDVAVLVLDVTVGITAVENELLEIFKDKKIPYVVAYNKGDLKKNVKLKENEILVSALCNDGINELREMVAHLAPNENADKHLVGDLVDKGDFVVLVVPIDESAPKGRLILPQQQAIRDLLEVGAIPVVCRDTELQETLDNIGVKPKMVITDSQAFSKVAEITPSNIILTSFSILMARYKGFLKTAVQGVAAIENLKEGDTVLIAEGCTHHRQCNDIGSVKIPNWLKNYVGENLKIELSSGTGFPEDLSKYKLIIHCGGCMLNEKEVVYRMKCAIDQGVPFTNYGTAIAYMKGILKRSIELFSDLSF
jgi:[FeFe] hydrogenase H-cluster maturation GTPase HydF